MGQFAGVEALVFACLGAWVGEWLLGAKLGWRAAWVGAVAASVAVFPAWLAGWVDEAAGLWLEGGPGHSLVAVGLAAWVVGRWWVPRVRKRWKCGTRELVALVVVPWLARVGLECMGPVGAEVFWPLPLGRVSLAWVDVRDPLLWVPMLVAVVVLAFARPRKAKVKARVKVKVRRRRWDLGCLAVVVVVVVAGGVLKSRVDRAVAVDLARRDGEGVATAFRSVPTVGNLLLWRIVAEGPAVEEGVASSLRVAYRSVLDGADEPWRWIVVPTGGDLLDKEEIGLGMAAVRRAGGRWLVARRHVRGLWVADLSAGFHPAWGVRPGMVDYRSVRAWDVEREDAGGRLRPLRAGGAGVEERVRRALRRIRGDVAAWEAHPRLAGVTGKLPEHLVVEP